MTRARDHKRTQCFEPWKHDARTSEEFLLKEVLFWKDFHVLTSWAMY